MQKFRMIFGSLPDPRAPNALHDLLDIIIIALAATLCGAKGATDMALFARSKEKALRQFLPLEHGIPSHDTFHRVLRVLDPEAFDKAFRTFRAAFAKANGIKLTGVVAIDGKALRGAFERGKNTTPFAHGQCLRGRSPNGAGLAQGARPQRSSRSVGSSAHAVARRLRHYGRCAALQSAVRCDGARTRRSLRAGAQAKPEQIVRCRCEALCPRRQAKRRQATGTVHSRPPRIPARHRYSRHQRGRCKSLSRCRCRGSHHLPQTPPWQARRQARRAQLSGSKYIAAKRLLQIVRNHWGIENRLHWVLDVVFDEDGNRTRKDNGPDNLAILRRFAINIISSHPGRISMRQKVKRAGWDDAFLLNLLSHMR